MTWPGVDGAQERLRSWAAGVSARAQAAVALSDQVAGLESTGQALDGAVRVRVDGAGRLVDLYLDERVRQVPAGEVAAGVLRAVALAQHGLNHLVAQAVAATVGAESETGRAVVDGFAAQYPDPEPAPEPGPSGVDEWDRDDGWLGGGLR